MLSVLMRMSGSDAIIVLAKEIWYCIDSLTNRYLRRSYEFYDVIASRIHSNGCGKFYRF